jgi:hypothetical protein
MDPFDFAERMVGLSQELGRAKAMAEEARQEAERANARASALEETVARLEVPTTEAQAAAEVAVAAAAVASAESNAAPDVVAVPDGPDVPAIINDVALSNDAALDGLVDDIEGAPADAVEFVEAAADDVASDLPDIPAETRPRSSHPFNRPLIKWR